MRHGAIHLFGHTHGNNKGRTTTIGRDGVQNVYCADVGVDCWDFKPVELKTIIQSKGWVL